MTKRTRTRAAQTREARGRVVGLLDPVLLAVLGRHEVIDRETLESIVEELEPGAGGSHRWLLLAVVVLLAVVGLAIGIAVFGGLGGGATVDNIIGVATNPAIFAVIVGGVIAPWFAARAARLKRVQAVMLRHRRCPHCGQGLQGVPVTDDGLTTCPECGCGWRLGTQADVSPAPARGARQAWPVVALILGAMVAALVGLFLWSR